MNITRENQPPTVASEPTPTAADFVLIVKLLLEHRADPSLADQQGGTALHCAAISRHAPLVTVLLEGGADVNARANNGQTPLMWAVRGADAMIVRHLLSVGKAAPDIADGQNLTALAIAMIEGQREIVDILLAHGANPGIPRESAVRMEADSRGHGDLFAYVQSAQGQGQEGTERRLNLLVAEIEKLSAGGEHQLTLLAATELESLCRGLYGERHANTVAAIAWKAHACRALGEKDAAMAHAKKCLEIYEATLGPDHELTVRARQVLGEIAGEPEGRKAISLPTPPTGEE
jgi:hypothetical protein